MPQGVLEEGGEAVLLRVSQTVQRGTLVALSEILPKISTLQGRIRSYKIKSKSKCRKSKFKAKKNRQRNAITIDLSNIFQGFIFFFLGG